MMRKMRRHSDNDNIPERSQEKSWHPTVLARDVGFMAKDEEEKKPEKAAASSPGAKKKKMRFFIWQVCHVVVFRILFGTWSWKVANHLNRLYMCLLHISGGGWKGQRWWDGETCWRTIRCEKQDDTFWLIGDMKPELIIFLAQRTCFLGPQLQASQVVALEDELFDSTGSTGHFSLQMWQLRPSCSLQLGGQKCDH